MRIISSQTLDALNSGRFGVRVLVKLSPSGVSPLCFWDDVGSIVYNSDTYVGSAGRFVLEPATSASDMSIRGLNVTFSGLDSVVVNMIEGTVWHQRPIQVFRAVFAVDEPQTIYVNSEFTGFMDRIEWREAADGQPSSLVLICESTSRELSLSGARTASDADQRQREPTDGFFSFTSSAIAQSFDWGRSPQQAPQQSKSGGIGGFLDRIF